ncbi:hypothetical protein EYB26_004790 [Talaromyces marneffei]|uniref:uncharacterized protein n=1 Tax=Talaromyces marneffei TaxID=37727 RepID=UPI0012A99B22|nr:uncharacterized protein EYB26_004790 [Talaromyces marneffei]QGA17120.1 hypothetical protein EYB26_004790 [Talaromyces marneffei]
MDGLKIEQLQSLQSKDQAALLDTVDEIRRHGVNRYVSLPQLIVSGDQSSGKSSVLEAISGVQFPVNDGLCTRFTTEVILRRATKSLATVKLIPSKDAPQYHKEKLSLFEKSSLNHAEIPDLISEAKTFMGLTGTSTFSRDVLQLEVSGPKLPHLTLVDLPGLIHHPNKEQTEEDVRIPKELVQKYMSQPRSIVLAIVTAKNDTSNQVVLEMAKAADPEGSRTMGIITKPDCLIKDSPNESNFFALASNKETHFRLDWHVLRNGDFNERKDSGFNRDTVEKDFFASTIWKNLPSHKRGVEALRTRLSHVLYQQIQKELPSLIKEIEAELAACKTTLDRLGAPRDTPSSRRQYLTGIAGQFLDLVRAGTEGIYQDPFFRPLSSGFSMMSEMKKTRLRAKVRMEEQAFLNKMHKYGHTHIIVSEGFNGEGVNPQERLFETGSKDGQTVIPEERYLSKIRNLLDISKGRELPGTFTPLIVGDLFIHQSKNWKPFAMDFVESVWNLVTEFLDDVLIYVADENVRQALLEEIVGPAMEKILAKLKDKVTELHSPYARASPATLNPRFVKELEHRRSQQAANLPVQPISLFNKTYTNDSDWHACRELLLLMQTYYTIALDVFVDNISNLAVENCLMNALENLLSPLTVSEMSDEELENIAFESPDIHELRTQTLEKQLSLQKSFDLCRRQGRKLASNRLNEEAQKAVVLPTSVTEGLAKVNISPAASTATPIKSEPFNGTISQPMTQGPATLPGSSGSGYSSTNGFGANTAENVFGTGGGFNSQGGLGYKDSFGSNTTGGGFGPTVIGSTSAFGTNTTGTPFGSVGGFGSTAPLASTPLKDVAALSKKTGLSKDVHRGPVDFSYFAMIPTSAEIVSSGSSGEGGYGEDQDSRNPTMLDLLAHISAGSQRSPFTGTVPCKYSAEEIRLKDYHVFGLPNKVPAKEEGI